MKIEVFAPVHNEEKILPYFLRHYQQFADVILFENNSTDKTVKIAEKAGAKVIVCDIPNEIDDLWLMHIKNSGWIGSKADWVIVVDADEFVYHPNIVKALTESKATLILPRFINMYSDKFPKTKGQIYEEVNMGTEESGEFIPVNWGRKLNIFRPSEIRAINYTVGCHNAFPEGNVIIDDKSDILTLHMRYLSKEYVNAKNAHASGRLSKLNHQKGWGFQYKIPPETVNADFDIAKAKAIKIV